MGKKNPYAFTVQFNRADPRQEMAAAILNGYGHGKARFLTEAILSFTGQADAPSIPTGETLKKVLQPIVREILREENTVAPVQRMAPHQAPKQLPRPEPPTKPKPKPTQVTNPLAAFADHMSDFKK